MGVGDSMLTNRQMRIIRLLLEYPDPLTSNDMASLFCVSNKKIQEEIQYIKDELGKKDIEVETKANGYSIRINQAALEYYQHLMVKLSYLEMEVEDDRVYSVLLLLLTKPNLTYERIANHLFVSTPLIFNMKDTVEKILHNFNLEFNQKGLNVEGDLRDKINLAAYVLFKIDNLELLDSRLAEVIAKNTKELESTNHVNGYLRDGEYRRIVYSVSYLEYMQLEYVSSNDECTPLMAEIKGKYASLIHDLILSYDEEYIEEHAKEYISKEDTRACLKELKEAYQIHVEDLDEYSEILVKKINSVIHLHELHIYPIYAPLWIVRENSPVSYICSLKVRDYIYKMMGIYVDEKEMVSVAYVFQQAFSRYNRLKKKLQIIVVSFKKKNYANICAGRMRAAYGEYIQDVKVLSKYEFLHYEDHYDLAVTDYPVEDFADKPNIVYNPLILNEYSMVYLKNVILQINTLQEKIISRINKKKAYATISGIEAEVLSKEMDAIINYSYGISMFYKKTNHKETRITFYTTDKPLKIDGNMINKICYVESGSDDSLHVVGKPLRMVIQDVFFLINLAKIQDDEGLIQLLEMAIEQMQEVVY